MLKKVIAGIMAAGFIMASVASDNPEGKRLGGAGGIEFGVMKLNLDPLEKIVNDDLDREGFDFDNNNFLTLGFVGYSGQQRNGIRIGWGGWVGYNSMYSDEWQGLADSAYQVAHGDSIVDSIIQLHTMFAHTGLIVERSFLVFNNLNLYCGGMLGGGVLMAFADRRLAGNAFRDVEYNSKVEITDSSITINGGDESSGDKAAFAPLWAFDVHGGATYSLTRWMHLGFDASAVFYYSSTGFGYRHGSFFTVNPSIRIRLAFGTSA